MRKSPTFAQKKKAKKKIKLFIPKIYMIAYHTNTCFSFLLPKIVEKLIKRLFDFLSQQKFHFTTSSAYSLSSEVNFQKVWAWLFQFDHSYVIINATTWS